MCYGLTSGTDRGADAIFSDGLKDFALILIGKSEGAWFIDGLEAVG